MNVAFLEHNFASNASENGTQEIGPQHTISISRRDLNENQPTIRRVSGLKRPKYETNNCDLSKVSQHLSLKMDTSNSSRYHLKQTHKASLPIAQISWYVLALL